MREVQEVPTTGKVDVRAKRRGRTLTHGVLLGVEGAPETETVARPSNARAPRKFGGPCSLMLTIHLEVEVMVEQIEREEAADALKGS